MVRAIETYGPRPDRYSGVSGLVGSQGRSQAAFRTRMSRQARASRARTGRKPTEAPTSPGSISVAGHPRIRATVHLLLVQARNATHLSHDSAPDPRRKPVRLGAGPSGAALLHRLACFDRCAVPKG